MGGVAHAQFLLVDLAVRCRPLVSAGGFVRWYRESCNITSIIVQKKEIQDERRNARIGLED